MSEFIDQLMDILKAEWIPREGIIGLMSIIVMLLIPIAVLTLDSKRNTFPIDNRIVFKKIFMHKCFIALIIPISISFLFPQIQLLSAISTIVLAVISMVVLSNTFKWLIDGKNGTEAFRQKTRIEYLKKIQNENEIINTWSAILKSDSQFNQTGLLDTFLNSLDCMDNTNNDWNRNIFWGLLRDNYQKFEYDDTETYKKLVDKTLEYYSERNLFLEDGENNKSKLKRPSEASRQVSQILLKESLTNDTNSIKSYLYFNNVERYLKKLGKKQQSLFLKAYLDDFIECFVNNDVNYYDKWHGDFFNRITINSLNEKAHNTQIIMNSYCKTIVIKYVCRSTNPPDEIAKRIDFITQYIFKEINPITWFHIITFIMWPYPYGEDSRKDIENRIINWCKRNKNYGIFGRFDCSIFSIPEADEKTKQKILQEKITNDIRKEQEATYKTIVKFLNLSDFDCKPYLTVIPKLKVKHKENQLMSERLNTLQSILKQLEGAINAAS